MVMRVMCRRGFTMDMADLLMSDYRAALAFLASHPAAQLAAAEGTGFHHTQSGRVESVRGGVRTPHRAVAIR
ncbi:MAG: hypothetical protein MZV65_31170 [Chromatiales bacterium]|nr:hypothetical protein [Chromatiales bacterium]